MNYIKQLNEFYSTLDYKPLSANSIAIYFVLLQVANKTGWIDKFKVANTVLMSKCDLNMQKLIRARNSLINQGYIKYLKGKNQNDAPTYSIIRLYDDTAKNRTNNIANDIADNITNDTINKQNKTKQNKKGSSSIKDNLYNPEVEKLQEVIIETIGTTNINNTKECIDYLEKLPIELIEYALRKTARIEHPSWQYTIPILESYISKKFRSIEEVKADDLKHRSKNNYTLQEETEEEKNKRKLKALEEGLVNDTK